MVLMFLNGDGMRGGRAHYTIEAVPLVGERRTRFPVGAAGSGVLARARPRDLNRQCR